MVYFYYKEKNYRYNSINVGNQLSCGTKLEYMEVMNIVVMVIVGVISGTLAARIVKGTNFGLLINALLGIAGAVVGGFVFNLLKITPGENIVKVLSDTFQVDLPVNIVGMVVSGTVGAVIILIIANALKIGKSR